MGENSSSSLVGSFCSKGPVNKPFLAPCGGTHLGNEPTVDTIIESWHRREDVRLQLLAVLDQSRRVA